VSPKSCEAKRAYHHDAWDTRIARIKANGGVRLRDISALANQCVDPQSYRFCTKAYKSHIHASLGENPDIKVVARQPLFSLLNAPEQAPDSSPIFADTLIHQAYISTDWFERERKGRRLLVCTTSRTHTLSMPLQVFQAYARQHFDGIAYLFDTDRKHYQTCHQLTLASVRSLVDTLEPEAVGFVGTSAGACMAIHLSHQHQNAKVLAGSPVLSKFPRLNDFLESAAVTELHPYLRITYGDNPIDNQHRACFDRLSAEDQARVAYNMSYINPTHASLGVTTLNGMFNELLDWLAKPSESKSKLP
jgi:hypothetical protein